MVGRYLLVLALLSGVALAREPVAFDEYRDLRHLAADFELGRGAWSLAGPRLTGETASGRSAAVYAAVPLAGTFQIDTRITVNRRLATSGWAVAGIGLYLDSSNFWQLALVEGPDKRRYLELVEMAGGQWQAQQDGATRLVQTVHEGADAGWAYGTPYTLRLSMNADEVRGELLEVPEGRMRSQLAFRWDGAHGVREGRAAMLVSGMSSAFEQLGLVVQPPDLDESTQPGAAGTRGRVLVLDDVRPALDHRTIDAVAATLEQAGFSVGRVSYEQLCDPTVLEPRRVAVLVLTDSRAYPAKGREPLLRYLAGGGDLVLLGGRAFRELLHPTPTGWRTTAELEAEAAGAPERQILFDFEGELNGWTRATDRPETATTLTSEPGPHGQCARLQIVGLQGWDNQEVPFPPGATSEADAVSLWLRADDRTPQICLELKEEDGSRWIAVVDVTPNWQRYLIPLWRFHYWIDSTSRGRGGPEDGVVLGQVRSLKLGLAASHTGRAPGDHTIWFDDLGLAATGLPNLALLPSVDLPLFSDYGVYRYPAGCLASATGQTVISPLAAAPEVTAGWSAIGFGFPNESRYLSLIDIRDAAGRVRGSGLGLVMNYRGRYRDSGWLFSGIEDSAVYRGTDFLRALAEGLTALTEPALAAGYRRDALAELPDLPLTTPSPAAGFITRSADGQHLIYPDGRRFFMVGCNYVGHFDRCGGRMWADDYYDPRLVEQDFQLAHQAGLNVMRYWISGDIDDDLRRGELRKVTAIRECARRYGIYLLLTLPGTHYPTEAAVVESHRNIARAFADEPMVLGYDLRNEPYVTTLGGIRYRGEPAPIQRSDLRDAYPGKVSDDDLTRWIAERPTWLHLPTGLQGGEALKVGAAWALWNLFTRESQLSSSTLPGLGESLPTGTWEPLIAAVDESLERWLTVQIEAIRSVDPNHLITVGHNTALAALPANRRLDFVSHHVYARPQSHAEVVENLQSLDRLAARWPDRPITLGEFGYSNGIPTGTGYLDDQTSAVGELAHFLYAYAHGYDGALKWMLCDWPLAIMKRYNDWDRGLETRIYEERFGLYAYDGLLSGRPKPIVPALRFFRDYLDAGGSPGTLDLYETTNAIGTGFVYRAPQALFIGDGHSRDPRLAFEADTPRNVMLRWDDESLQLMAADDTQVRLRLGPAGLAAVSDVPEAGPPEGDWLPVDLLAGRTVRLPRR